LASISNEISASLASNSVSSESEDEVVGDEGGEEEEESLKEVEAFERVAELKRYLARRF